MTSMNKTKQHSWYSAADTATRHDYGMYEFSRALGDKGGGDVRQKLCHSSLTFFTSLLKKSYVHQEHWLTVQQVNTTTLLQESFFHLKLRRVTGQLKGSWSSDTWFVGSSQHVRTLIITTSNNPLIMCPELTRSNLGLIKVQGRGERDESGGEVNRGEAGRGSGALRTKGQPGDTWASITASPQEQQTASCLLSCVTHPDKENFHMKNETDRHRSQPVCMRCLSHWGHDL